MFRQTTQKLSVSACTCLSTIFSEESVPFSPEMTLIVCFNSVSLTNGNRFCLDPNQKRVNNFLKTLK